MTQSRARGVPRVHDSMQNDETVQNTTEHEAKRCKEFVDQLLCVLLDLTTGIPRTTKRGI